MSFRDRLTEKLRPEQRYPRIFAPVDAAQTFPEAVVVAEGIVGSGQLADYLQSHFVRLMLRALGKDCDWSAPGHSPELQLRAARVLCLAARFCHDTRHVLYLLDPITGFPAYVGDSPVAEEIREVHAITLGDMSSLAITTREASELANSIGRSSHYRRSEPLQLQIARCLLAAASVEDSPEALAKIEARFEKLPSRSQTLREMKTSIKTVAGTRVQTAQEGRAELLMRESRDKDGSFKTISARVIREMSRYTDSARLQAAQLQILLDPLEGREQHSVDLQNAFQLLFDNPEFWRDRLAQDRYLSATSHLLERFGYQYVDDGLASDRYFESEVLYQTATQMEETPQRKAVNQSLARYRNAQRR